MTGRPLGLPFRLAMLTSSELNTPDGGLGSDHFPKRGHTWCHHSWVRSFPWARFFDGDVRLQKASGHGPGAAVVYSLRVSNHVGRGRPRGRFFKISISTLSFAFSRRTCSRSSAAVR